jgi:arylsulfatase A-like enzyme
MTPPDAAHRRPPSIVLINCDDLGYGDLGCYGSPVNATPALDRLAAEGVRFTSFCATSPVCSPSRGSLLTGCYPQRIGFGSFDGLPVLFPGQGIGLSPEETSLAGLLRGAGYRTAMVGKWHCGDQPGFLPTDHGFEHYLGLPYSNDMGRQVAAPGERPWDLPPLPLLRGEEVVEQQPDQATLTDRYVDEAVAFLREHRDEPVFLYLAHMYVHVPIYVTPDLEEASDNGRYGAAVAAIDRATDVLLRELDALGLADDTIVIFTSDNGSRGVDGGSNAPLRGAKTQTWEGGVRVPCIVRWPGVAPAGVVTDRLASMIDLYPTLAGAAGIDLGPIDVGPASPLGGTRVDGVGPVDGRDIRPLLADPSSPSPHDRFAYYWMDDLEAVRVGRWKLRLHEHGRPHAALHDLDADPGETDDRHAAEPDVVARLSAVADEVRADLGDAVTGIDGSGRRLAGRVADPRPLTTYDPDHPYVHAEYDLPDRG